MLRRALTWRSDIPPVSFLVLQQPSCLFVLRYRFLPSMAAVATLVAAASMAAVAVSTSAEARAAVVFVPAVEADLVAGLSPRLRLDTLVREQRRLHKCAQEAALFLDLAVMSIVPAVLPQVADSVLEILPRRHLPQQMVGGIRLLVLALAA